MDTLDNTPDNTYDHVPYPSYPHPESHPHRLLALAKVLGLDTPDGAGLRVLELGCAAGGNLIPLAFTLPQAELVGIDLSQSQIDVGLRAVETLGLGGQVTLIPGDISLLEEDPEGFDVIIAHGLLSWVDEPTRSRVFSLMYKLLRDNGLAYLCYSTYPGYHQRAMVRDAALFHTKDITSPKERGEEGRRILHFLSQNIPEDEPARGVYTSEKDTMERAGGAWYLLHDLMETDHNALYLKDFIMEAEGAGLGYLSDVHLGISMPEMYPPQVAGVVGHLAKGRLEAEQYLDFVHNRALRRSVLIKGPTPDNVKANPQHILRMHLASSLSPALEQPDSGVAFESRDGFSLTIDHPLAIAGLQALGQAWPSSLSFGQMIGQAYAVLGQEPARGAELNRDCGVLANFLLRCWIKGALELSPAPLPHTLQISAAPVAHPLARLWCQGDEVVPNYRHEPVRLTAAAQSLLPHLDGTMDLKALKDATSLDEAALEACLIWMAERALLSA